jgi:hypothetical protein
MSGTHTSGKRYMRYFVYWPVILHPQPIKRVLVICYGAGVTVGAATSIGAADTISVVEVSPDIVRMSDTIYANGRRPLDDPRVHLHLEDGRYFLQATADRFDVITGEPPPPLTPGAVTLYTREYFALIRNRLADGGVATYWLPAARRGEYDVRSIIAAFCSVFDDCSLWNGTVFDWMLVGSRHLAAPTREQFVRPWNDPASWPLLRETGFEVPGQIGATFLGDREDLLRLSSGAAALTDDRPQRLQPRPGRLSMTSGPSVNDSNAAEFVARVTNVDRARSSFIRSPLVRRLWPADLIAETLPYFHVQSAINRIMSDGPDPVAHIEEVDDLLTHTTLRRAPLWALGSDDAQQEAVEDTTDPSGDVQYILGIRALVARQYVLAAQSFATAESHGFRASALRPLLAYALCLSGQRDPADSLARQQSSMHPDQTHFWTWLGSRFHLPSLTGALRK